jgi:ankyrin repeat protein
MSCLPLGVRHFSVLILLASDALAPQKQWTPLHEASHAGILSAMRTLLDAGADIEARVEVRACARGSRR